MTISEPPRLGIGGVVNIGGVTHTVAWLSGGRVHLIDAAGAISVASPGELFSTPGTTGAVWTDLPVPDVAPAWALAGIGGVAPDDLWAVGHGQPGRSVALHWDGQDWQQTPVPAPGSGTAKLCDVAALASNDVWAAGYRTAPGGVSTRQPLAVHWDGSTWSPGDMPARPGQIWQLVQDHASIWGIGYAPDSTPIVARMTSSAWQFLPGPAAPGGTRHSSLHGGAILPDGNLLVVGATSTSPDTAQPFAAVRRN